MSLAALLAVLTWDLEVRGILVVVAGTAVLMGSVWLLLATNVGARLGALLAFSGFFAWMVIMGLIWWVFGIGWIGDAPEWQTEEVVVSELRHAEVEPVRELVPPDDLPRAYDLVVASDHEEAIREFASPPPEEELEGLTPEEREVAIADRELQNRLTTLSDLATVATELTEDIELGADWRLVSSADAGEAMSAASAALVERGFFDSTGDFIVRSAFARGGKPRLDEDPSTWDRVWHRISTTVNFLHPTHHSVVHVRPVIPQEPEPGQPPPRPIPDEDEPVVTVVMVRDLGTQRVPAAMTTIGSLLLFIVTATMLHYRDKESMERQAALARKS